MTKIYFFIGLICLTFLFSKVVVAQKCGDDCWKQTIKWRFKEKASGFSSSFSFKRIVRLGDLTAITLQKMFSDEEILEKSKISIFLSIFEESFAYPNSIDRKQDKIPINTLQLLKKLQTKNEDSEISHKIDETLKKINEYSKKIKKE